MLGDVTRIVFVCSFAAQLLVFNLYWSKHERLTKSKIHSACENAKKAAKTRNLPMTAVLTDMMIKMSHKTGR